jgi:CBS domain-containing protein
MEAKDIMTSPAITVVPDTPLHDVVDILLRHRISGVLVMDGARVVGVLGHGDLLHRREMGTHGWTGYRTWWQRLMRSDPGPDAYVKSHGARVRDVMNHEVISVREDTSLMELATIFEKRHIRRLPVLRGDQLVGLVTRADLMRALAVTTAAAIGPQVRTDDEAIKARLTEELEQQSWWSGSLSNIFVQNGVVIYVGIAQSKADRQAARVAAENIPGVRAVEDRRLLEEDWQPML